MIAAAAGAGLFEQEIASDHYRARPVGHGGSVALARRLSTTPAFGRDDIDVAMIYDAFSPILLMQLEALGFCGLGEAKDFVARRQPRPRGRAAVQHQRRPDRRGLHPRAEPGLGGRAPAPAAPPPTSSPIPSVVLVTASRTGTILPSPEPDHRRSAHGQRARRLRVLDLSRGSPGPSPACCWPTTAPTSPRSSRPAATLPGLPGSNRPGCAAGAVSSSTCTKPEDRDTFLALADRADVVLESFSPGTSRAARY